MTFALDLQKFAAKAGKRADAVVGEVVTLIAREVDRRSPVGDATYWKHPAPKGYLGGHFRGNWQMGINVRPSGEVPGVDPSGAATVGRIVAAIPDKASGNVYWLANNAPYALRLEHGYSRQAPQGVVGLTVSKFQTIVSEAVASAKGATP